MSPPARKLAESRPAATPEDRAISDAALAHWVAFAKSSDPGADWPRFGAAETTLEARNRRLLKVEIDSLVDTDRTFVDLLGKDASQRQRFVMDRAAEVAPDEVDV